MSAPIKVRASNDPTYDVDPGRGWILFAGVMLSIVGVLNLIYGIAAIDNSTFFVKDTKYIFGNLNTWGWILTIVGVVQLITAVGVFISSEWGRWLGILAAGANMIVQFIFIADHPGLSIMIFFVDVIIIFGLLTYGGRDRDSLAG
jgi:hypothetical protein